MAYTLLDQDGCPKPIRIIATNQPAGRKHRIVSVGCEFTPAWWVCDPCNSSQKRFEVTHSDGAQVAYYPWYAIVTADDAPADVQMKCEHFVKALNAADAVQAAQREFERLNGGR